MDEQKEEVKPFRYYLRLFVLNKRVLILAGIPLFCLLMIWAFSTGSATEKDFVITVPILLELVTVLLTALVAAGAHEIEKIDEKTFWYMFLSLFIGVMIFMIPTLVLAQVASNILREIPFIVLVILSAIPPQIPVMLKYRKYLNLFSKEWYIPNPQYSAIGFAVFPGFLIALLALILDPEWIPIDYFSALFICITVFLLSLFLSYRRALKVIKKDGEEIKGMIRIR
jgi:hypothetical protein